MPVSAEADRKARRQLGRVLLLLGILDLTVLLLVLILALGRDAGRLSNIQLAAAITAGASMVVLARVLLAIRLRARGGNLT